MSEIRKAAIIGGGVIGCEFASLYAILGVEVVILEMMPRIIPISRITDRLVVGSFGRSLIAVLRKA